MRQVLVDAPFAPALTKDACAMTTSPLCDDPTLEEVRAALAPRVAAEAADAAGVDADIARLAFPGGAADMIDAWFAHIDAAMLDRLPADQLAAMKIRDRITALVEARLAIIAPCREALRRALSVLALPGNIRTGAQLAWRSADAMWAAAGDTATDLNHYSKRAILSGVYGATIAVFLNDDSEDHQDTRAFLARRIDGVMRFERWKHARQSRRGERPSLARFIGRLRYRAN